MSCSINNFSNFEDNVKVNDINKKISRRDLYKNICKHKIAYDGADDLKIKIIKNKITNESGSSDRFRVKLIGAKKIYGRIKKLDNINEAIIYHKINSSNDHLKPYLPSYMGVFDKKGHLIDLEKELEAHSVDELCKKYQVAYIMMKDLAYGFLDNVKIDSSRSIKDFKFVRPSLIGNDDEVVKHSHISRSSFYKKARDIYFSMSNCSFAFQRSTKSRWYTWLIVNIKRLIGIIRTKEKLKNQFQEMDREELEANIHHIHNLKNSVKASNFAFSDSSLLLIPTTKIINDKEVKSLQIHLIDLGHGFSKDEGIAAFDAMQQEMVDCLEELLVIMNSALEKRDVVP